MFFGSKRLFNVALGSFAKAALVGANTVKGPLACRAVTSLPAVRAVTSVERLLVPAASSTMLLLAAFAILAGTNTVSMMCTTPLVAPTSAVVTLALPLMCTPFQPFVTNNCWPSSVLTCCEALRSLLYTAAPATTWYSSTASNCLMFSGSNRLCNVALGSLAKASLVGANTVNGPSPSRAVTSLPAVRAVTSVERSLVLAASSTMLFDADADWIEMLSNSMSKWPAYPVSWPFVNFPVLKRIRLMAERSRRVGGPPSDRPRHDCEHDLNGTLIVWLLPQGAFRSTVIGQANSPFLYPCSLEE